MSFMDVINKTQLGELNKHHKKDKNIFVLIYMNGCDPCKKTKPEWEKLKNQFENIIIAQIDKDVLPSANSKETFCLDVDGFPTIRHYYKNKKKEYDGHSRDVESFKKWIKSQLTSGGKTKRRRRHRRTRIKKLI